MAELQKKVFTWGSYAYKSVSNAYVLELTLTENSINKENNTSNISYALVLKSGSNNRFTGQVDSIVKLNGEQVASGSKQITAAYNSSWTLLTGTTNVAHGADGSLDMPIEVSIDTYNSYAPPDKTLSWSWGLTIIPRASSITSAAAVTLGNACTVKWTPNSAAFRYKLKFSLGDWSDTTDAIHPNKTSAYTYTGYEIPLADVAQKITSSKTGEMTVELTTYSDSDCKTVIGTDTDTFTVTVPENEYTQPTVEMSMSLVQPSTMPEGSNLYGLCLQGFTRIQATEFGADGKLGAEIDTTKYSLEVEGISYGVDSDNKAVSDPIMKTGWINIVGKAVDTRGISGTVTKETVVYPYGRPAVVAEVYRCNSDGTPADDGTFLKIKATAACASVAVDGEEKNSASIVWRIRRDDEDTFNEYAELLTSTTDAGNITCDLTLMEGTLSSENAYEVEIRAVDQASRSNPVLQIIPAEPVYLDKPHGGNGMGLGGYCEQGIKGGLLDVHWNIRGRKGLLLGYGVGSVYLTVGDETPESIGCEGTWVQWKTSESDGLNMWKRFV